MSVQDYLNEVQSKWLTGIAREHAYRPALENLVKKVLPDLTALNDPARIHVGTLDFIIRKGDIDVGYIEAKDVNVNLDKTEKSEQLQRYLDLDNLILTDYLEFRFYREGVKVDTVRIGDALMGKIQPRPENFEKLKILLEEFGAFKGQTIRSAEKLAIMMARKARLMREVFHEALKREEPSTLKDQCKAFKDILMHDLDEQQFADIYAQTLTYGLFTARLHDPTLEDFSRAEAQNLIPKSNPFLQQLFHYVTGPNLDKRVVWIVDDLCNLFQATNVRRIFEDYGKNTRQTDPVLHFYETFLGTYDKTMREIRGVWYTPEPVVKFIVRAIDDVLKTHFDLKDGIADNSKIEILLDTQTRDDRSPTGYKRVKKEIHKVQLLDVATGTGTFLAETVKQIHEKFVGMEGIWSSYVEKDLLPRMHGFELLMASYAMCHMKLDLLLSELGYKPSNPDEPPRVSVYLTNSLEEHHKDADTLFASWLSKEANEASRIKRDMPIMVAFGNPPYSGISSNMNSWIAKNKIEDYKYVDGVHFGERKHWLNDDYVQFIRLGEHYIEKNGEGVLAYITNHSYLDNPTFRGMRWHLLNTFDDIYVLDLHGNSLKKETMQDGSPDKNVFDIMQGVSIIIGIKKKRKNKRQLASVYHAELYGKRADKYAFLSENTIQSVEWEKLDYREPYYFFIPKNHEGSEDYQSGFPLDELFPVNVTGIVTARDGLVIDDNREELKNRIEYFANPENTDEQVRQKFFGNKKDGKYKAGDTRSWMLDVARQKIKDFDHDSKLKILTNRPFDDCWIYYTPEMIDWGREDFMRNFLDKDNLGLILSKRVEISKFSHVFTSRKMIQHHTMSMKEVNISFPLYRYEAVIGNIEQKVANLDPVIFAKIKDTAPDATPENIFDYIYAVLHSPAYRERYAEFLKSDFPRIPYPLDPKIFHDLSDKGSKIRSLHLLESPLLVDTGVTYPISGNNMVGKHKFESSKVWINEDQYFDGVSQTAWEFYIGGYQPAQKWLKDRKGRALTMDDIQHYRKIIKALHETDRLMKEIDQIDFLPGGG